VLDIGHVTLDNSIAWQDDVEALSEDWEAVGDDMREALIAHLPTDRRDAWGRLPEGTKGRGYLSVEEIGDTLAWALSRPETMHFLVTSQPGADFPTQHYIEQLSFWDETTESMSVGSSGSVGGEYPETAKHHPGEQLKMGQAKSLLQYFVRKAIRDAGLDRRVHHLITRARSSEEFDKILLGALAGPSQQPTDQIGDS